MFAAQLLTLVLLAPGAASGPHGMRAERIEVWTRTDAGLESMRAGKIEPPSPIREDDRTALRAAEARSPGLEDMRAGGAVGVLAVVVLLLLILILI